MENQGSTPHYQAPLPPTPSTSSSPSLPPSPKSLATPRSSLVTAALPILYVAVLIIAMISVYATQNGQLHSVKQQLATAQATATNQSDEANTIDSNRYQAVFLNTGQVYFGKMSFIDQHYLKLTNIYYLQTGGQNLQPGSQALQSTSSTSTSLSTGATSSTSVALVKLGCEIHGPSDQMTINRDHVDFWENLQNQSQVVRAIQSFTKANPAGQHCSG